MFRLHPHSRQSPRGDWNRPYFIRPQRVPLTRQSDKGSDKIWYKSTAYWPTQNTTTWYCSGSSAVQRWDENERLLKSCVFLSEYWNWNTVLRRWMFHSLLMHWQSRLWLSGWQLVGLGPGSKKKRDNMVSATPTAYKDFKLEKWPICTNMLRTRSRVSCQKMKMWSHL